MDRVHALLLAVLAGCLCTAQAGRATGAPAPAGTPAPATGAAVYGKWCSDCHSTPGGPGSMALERKYHGQLPAILNQRSDLSADYIAHVVRHGVSFMPSFRKTEISDTELAAIGTYLMPPSRRPAAKAPKSERRARPVGSTRG